MPSAIWPGLTPPEAFWFMASPTDAWLVLSRCVWLPGRRLLQEKWQPPLLAWRQWTSSGRRFQSCSLCWCLGKDRDQALIGLAKKFIQVFPASLIEKPRWTFLAHPVFRAKTSVFSASSSFLSRLTWKEWEQSLGQWHEQVTCEVLLFSP